MWQGQNAPFGARLLAWLNLETFKSLHVVLKNMALEPPTIHTSLNSPFLGSVNKIYPPPPLR